MNSRNRSRLSVACALSLASLTTVNGLADTILVSNLAEPIRSATPIADPEFWGAQSFITDNRTHLLSSIQALAGNALDEPGVVAEIRSSDINGQIDQTVGGLLATLTAPDLTGELSARLFTPNSAVTLQPNSHYWFTLGVTGAGTYDWAYANTNGFIGDGFMDVFADSSDAGATWTYRDFTFPYFLQVNVSATEAQWNVDDDGDWSVATNWIDGPPNAVGAIANFGAVIQQSRTVTVDEPQTVGQMNFDNANAYIIAGTELLTLDGTAGEVSINAVSGSHAISAPLMLAAATSISVAEISSTLTVSDLQPGAVTITKSGAGALVLNNVRQSALAVDAGVVAIIPDGTNNGVSRVTTLTIDGGVAPTASLDLADNDLIVTASSYSEIAGWVRNARNGGAWDSTGITSSAAQAHPDQVTTLGVFTGDEYLQVNGPGAMFGGFAVVETDTLAKYTWYGDSDLNGVIDFDDYVHIDGGFNNELSGWFNGDFDYNDTIDFDDYVLIDFAFNMQNGTLIDALNWLEGEDRSGSTGPGVQMVIRHYEQFGLDYVNAFYASVPEPGALSVVALIAGAVTRRRRN